MVLIVIPLIHPVLQLSHSIISACRLKSFISPILLAITVNIHKKYVFHELTKMFPFSLEISDHIISMALHNADFKVTALTGHYTSPSMGGFVSHHQDQQSNQFLIVPLTYQVHK